MKKLTYLFNLGALAAFISFTAFNIPSDRPFLTSAYVKQELTSHQWVLSEIVQTKNDTATNLTLFMLPCEKDNILDYETNQTYQILEGDKKCSASDNKVKGTGTWEYEESDQALIDSYAGGRRIEKKVLELSPGMLKVQFESEGRQITTLTYLSEVGLKDDAQRDRVVDNSDNTKSVTMAPREAMLEARRYALIGLYDFKKGVLPPDLDVKGGLAPKVCVYPFINSTNQNETVSEAAHFKALLAQGKKMGLNYIVTGNIIKASSDVGNDGKHLGNVKYSVTVLDVKAGAEKKTQIFEFSQKAENDRKEGNARLLGVLLGGSSYNMYYGYRRSHWNYYYGYYFYPNSNAIAANGLSSAFASNANNDERKKYFDQSVAVTDAISQTSEKLTKFIIENIPVQLKINRVDDEKKGLFTVEGGANINMQEGEHLKVVRVLETTLSDGTVESETIEICKVRVTEVKSSRLSSCKVDMGGASKLSKALKENPEQLFVHTTELYRAKK